MVDSSFVYGCGCFVVMNTGYIAKSVPKRQIAAKILQHAEITEK
jgi:hypothetical protein